MLLSTLQQGPVSIDLFLRTLNALNEDVVVNEESNGYDSEVAARVKDGMREQCLVQIADAWMSILRLHESAPALSAACLQTVALYVPWIPISLVANPLWLGLLQPFLSNAQLHEGSCAVLMEIVVKRMEPQAKMEHLQNLQIVARLNEGVGGSNGGVPITTSLAALVSALAMELLDCWDRLAATQPPTPRTGVLVPQSVDMLSQAFPLLLSCFAAEEMETSQSTLAFLHSYIGRLKKLLPSPKDLQVQQEGHLQHLLIVLGRKSVHPLDFGFDEPDEAEEAFITYRRELSTLFKGVTRVHPSLAQEFVRSTLLTTLESLASVPWAHLEVALWLLYTLGEGLPETVIREKNGTFHQLMSALFSSQASSYPHRSIQLLTFEIHVRYYRFYLTNPDHLGAALAAFLDERGLYHQTQAVRAKACYLLLRFVKQTIKSAQGDRNYLEVVGTLVEVIRQQQDGNQQAAAAAAAMNGNGHRVYGNANGSNGHHPPPATAGSRGPAPQLSHTEQLNLYEACGLILGANLNAIDQVGEQLRLLLERPLTALQALSAERAAAEGVKGSGGSPPRPPSIDRYDSTAEAARSNDAAFRISVVAVVSKGFTSLPSDSNLLRETFSRSTQVALNAMASFGDSPEVRSKALMLLHRMVETLGEALLTHLDSALPQLLTRADAKELIELITLINQLVLKFRGRILQPATALFSALAAATFQHLQSLDAAIAASSSASVPVVSAASDDVRERRNLLRCFYSLVHSLVHSECTEVLSAPQNQAHMAPSLRVLLSGCVEGPDLQLQRQCFSILQRLVEMWVGNMPGFESFVLQEILPVCFSAPAQPHFNLKDPHALPLIETSAALQKSILAKLGNELVPYLRERLLPSLGCTPEVANEYVRALCESDVRAFRDFIKGMLAQAQASAPAGGR